MYAYGFGWVNAASSLSYVYTEQGKAQRERETIEIDERSGFLGAADASLSSTTSDRTYPADHEKTFAIICLFFFVGRAGCV